MSADPRDEAGLLSAPLWVTIALGSVFAGFACWTLWNVAAAILGL